MLESIPVMIFVGTILGFLAGIGVGGGSLLMLWLTLAVGIEHSEARVINLLFFLPTAVIATIFRCRQGKLNLRKLLPAIIAGCISAGFCSWFSTQIDVAILKKSFGILLLITGVRELLYKKKPERS